MNLQDLSAAVTVAGAIAAVINYLLYMSISRLNDAIRSLQEEVALSRKDREHLNMKVTRLEEQVKSHNYRLDLHAKKLLQQKLGGEDV